MTEFPVPPTIVVVGAAARDLAPEDPRGWRLGGGVSYGALTSARLGLRTAALLGVDEEAETASELDLLREAGAEVRTVRLSHAPVFDNVETAGGRIQTGLSASEAIHPDDVPGHWRHAPGWLFGPVAGELGDEWATVPANGALVATGWQGLLRDIVPGERVRLHEPRPSALVRRSDLVGMSRDDVDAAMSLADLCRLLKPGATLALTQGAHGGLYMTAGPDGPTHLRHWPGIPSTHVVDPTGAGDTFLAALIAARVEPRLVGGRLDWGLDLRLAAAAASLVLEAPGLAGVPTRETIRHRMAEARRA